MSQRDESKKPLPASAVGAATNVRQADEIDKLVGTRLKVRRMELGFSQEKVAEQLGISFQQLQKYENGLNRVGASRLHLLAQILGTSVEYFFSATAAGADAGLHVGDSREQLESVHYAEKYLSNRDALELVRLFATIKSSHERKAILRIVRAMAARAAE